MGWLQSHVPIEPAAHHHTWAGNDRGDEIYQQAYPSDRELMGPSCKRSQFQGGNGLFIAIPVSGGAKPDSGALKPGHRQKTIRLRDLRLSVMEPFLANQFNMAKFNPMLIF